LRPWITSYAELGSAYLSRAGREKSAWRCIYGILRLERGSNRGEEKGVFHFTFSTLEQLHSEALLGFFFSSEGVVVYACEGRAEKVILQQRSKSLEGVSKLFLFPFFFLFSSCLVIESSHSS
jgi:hypothetical protein